MNRILVGFDGSEGAEIALNKAKMIIDENGEIILLSVLPLPSEQNLVDEHTYELMKSRAKQLIDTALQAHTEQHYHLKGLIEEGDVAAKIIDIANTLDCDLIVLGSTGYSQLGTYTLGSIANKVVQYAYKPVMVVR